MNTVELTKAHIMETMSTRSVQYEEDGYANQRVVDHHNGVEKIRLAMLPAFGRAVVPALERRLLPYVHTTQNYRALEIGCGTGFFYRRLAPEWLKERMLCLDINTESLTVFREMDNKAKLVRGSVYRTPFASESLDAITGYSSLDGSLFLDEALTELKRVLKKGGTLALFQDLMTDMYLFDGEAASAYSAVETVERYHERLVEEAEKAGFVMLEGDEFLTGHDSEHIDAIRKRTGIHIPFSSNFRWDRGVYDNFMGLRKVDYAEEGFVDEHVRMLYLVAVKPA